MSINSTNSDFLNPKDFTDIVKAQSGKNLYELMAEALEFERQNMLINANSKEYIKLLVPVFNKFAVPAPTKSEITNPLDEKTMQELEDMYNNLTTRAVLSTKSNAVDSPKTGGSTTDTATE